MGAALALGLAACGAGPDEAPATPASSASSTAPASSAPPAAATSLAWTSSQVGDGAWRAADISDDGQSVVIASGDGGTEGRKLFTSSDAGATWQQRQPAGADAAPAFFAVATGSCMLAAWTTYEPAEAVVARSDDAGATWTALQTPPTPEALNGGEVHWELGASEDCQHVLLAPRQDGSTESTPSIPRLSTDGGKTWSDAPGLQPAAWSDTWVSPDGKVMVAAGAQGDQFTVATTSDGGSSWTTQRAPATSGPQAFPLGLQIAASDDGQMIFALAADSTGPDEVRRLTYSSDGGGRWTDIALPAEANTWAQAAGAPSAEWRDLAVSGDGQSLAATLYAHTGSDSPASVWVSRDAGSNWKQQDAAIKHTNPSGALAMSADGQHLVYGADLGAAPVWIGAPAPG